VTVALALAAIATRLATIASPQTLKAIYPDPKEATSLGEFPCAILAESPGVVHTWGTEAAGGGSGLAEHDYTITIWLFTGARNTPIGELHSRTIPWSEAVFRALVADITLSGTVIQMGDGTSTDFFTYQIGPLDWGAQELWGVKILLPVVEKPVVAMN
jgi:hypothetical protein